LQLEACGLKIAITNDQVLAHIDRRSLRALCTRLLREHGVDADLSLAYVDAAAIRELNACYLGRGEATDVLAFPLGSGPDPDRLLGEIVVSVEKAVAEAHKRRIPVEREIALYTAHGVLHLLGYDDRSPAQRRRMRRRERRALAEAGLVNLP
jgi:probable rRNA maturation factor